MPNTHASSHGRSGARRGAPESDAVERALMARMTRVLNDTSLTRLERLKVLARTQDELVKHQLTKTRRRRLLSSLEGFVPPQGARPLVVQVRDGVVRVGAMVRGSRFVWLEAGQAPQDAAENDDFSFPGRRA